MYTAVNKFSLVEKRELSFRLILNGKCMAHWLQCTFASKKSKTLDSNTPFIRTDTVKRACPFIYFVLWQFSFPHFAWIQWSARTNISRIWLWFMQGRRDEEDSEGLMKKKTVKDKEKKKPKRSLMSWIPKSGQSGWGRKPSDLSFCFRFPRNMCSVSVYSYDLAHAIDKWKWRETYRSALTKDFHSQQGPERELAPMSCAHPSPSSCY